MGLKGCGHIRASVVATELCVCVSRGEDVALVGVRREKGESRAGIQRAYKWLAATAFSIVEGAYDAPSHFYVSPVICVTHCAC